MRFLKQSTSVKVPIGPFVDATDKVTPETGITLGAADAAEIIKHDSGSVTDISARTWAAITGADGMYNLTLDAADPSALGMMTVYIADTSVCAPVRADFMVLPANIYDSLIAGSDKLQVDVNEFNGNAASGYVDGATELRTDVIKVSGNSTAADNLEAAARTMTQFTVQTGSTTTTITTNLSESTDDHYNGRRIGFLTGVLAGQATDITNYDGASNNLTVTALTEAPGNGDIAIIV